MMSLHRVLRTAAVGIAVTAATATGLAAAAPAATAATCSVAWGSTPKTSVPMTQRDLVNVRSGRHTCYDRLVVDLNGAGSTVTGYSVRYVTTVYQDGSGERVPLRGGAKLQIVVKAPAYDDNGHSTYSPTNRTELVNAAGYRTFRQVAFAGSFEGQTTIGLGVRARLPMRVFRLAGPGTGERLVIDVAHSWS
jgi:hypothetical protein